MTTPRILLLEEDPAIARTVIYALERASLQVTHCLLVRDALQQIARTPYDVLVLDVGLPDGSGLDVCRQVRAQAATPVLMLSAHGEEIDRVLGLELGADDYVTKPFSPRELVARVRGLLRRAGPTAAAPAEPTSLFTVDTTAQRASLRQQPLDLTRREFGLLAELLRRPATSEAVRHYSTPCGASTRTAPSARWTPTSKHCAPSCSRPTPGVNTSAPTGAWVTPSTWKSIHDPCEHSTSTHAHSMKRVQPFPADTTGPASPDRRCRPQQGGWRLHEVNKLGGM